MSLVEAVMIDAIKKACNGDKHDVCRNIPIETLETVYEKVKHLDF